MTNDDLSKIVDTTDEWIQSRTGIRERRISKEDTTSDMAAKAAREAMRNARVQPEEIDLLVLATITPDMPFPSTACLTQHKLGLRKIPAFDIEAACTGFVYSLEIARSMMLAGSFRKALVIGAEKLSSITDWEDRTTCVLFGDGAGAVVLSYEESGEGGILGTHLGADGAEKEILFMPGGGSAIPATHESIDHKDHYLKMQGREVFKIAVRAMADSAQKLLASTGHTADDITLVIPHQANVRIIEALVNRLGIGLDRCKINLDRFGNTSAASIPIALDEAMRNARFKPGDLILLVAFGAGLTWGSSLIRWH